MRRGCFLVAILMSSVASPAAEGIAGVVESTKGVEPGVWVIAETTDLPTKFVKTVVTDDNGRFLIPDLPDATYKVWVRGYGLVLKDFDLPDLAASLVPRFVWIVDPRSATGSLLSVERAREEYGDAAEIRHRPEGWDLKKVYSGWLEAHLDESL